MTIGENLAAARKAQGLTQSQAADRLGVSEATLSNWERGKTQPQAGDLTRMSSVYRITTDRLLGLAA